MRPAALLLALGLVTGCSSSDPAAAPSAAPSPGASSLFGQPAGCPSPGGSTTAWPQAVPADLPQPPGAQVTDVEERPDGLTVVKFTTASSIRQSVLFLVDALPAAGYTLARGDAENTEADAPFVKGGLRGVMRMIAIEPCRTDWLMALTRGAPGGNPLLPVRPSASPLPFG